MEQIPYLVRAWTRRIAPAALVVIAALAAGACETSSTTSAGPTPVKCQVAVSTPSMLEAVGGTSAITVTTQPECAWTASSSANWISGLSPASGQGTGSVAFRVAANDGAAVREGTIVVNNEQARVSQRAPCRYVLTPVNQTIATSGGTSSVSVATDAECAWTATTDTVWISFASATTGTGAGVINFAVSANPGSERTGTITIAGQRATVVQSAAPVACNANISPSSQNFSASGGAGQSIAVTSPNTCNWTAQSSVSWITITSAPTGTGNGTVTFNVAANTGAARTGTIAIANRTFTVSQAAAAAPAPPACTYTIAPPSLNAPATASTGSVNLTTTAACIWTAVSTVPWITVTSGAAGTGNGAVGYSIAANTGAARTGTITIATETFTVTQATGVAPCTYSIAPPSQNVDANANTGTVAVTAGTGCTWTATSGVPWLTITAGATGSGNGSVGFSVAANTGGARSGTLTIAGQVFTVNQAAFVAPACTYSIAPPSQNVPALGGSGTVNVTTTAGCAWTASSNAPWLTVTSGATGNGNGAVGFTAGANIAGARSGTLTIAGQTFTVNQDGAVGPLSSPSQP